MRSFRTLVERQIQKTRLSGGLQGLKGEGKPLPDATGDAFTDPGVAAGFRMMAEAGVLPEEIRLKKQVADQRAVLAGVTDPEARKREMARLSGLMLRQSIAEEARRKFLKG
ncbi:DUF1992 domain-containing protein [Oceaniglobus roseus]|uniref:DnaJ family domain-containing protein n=1 Tax=Oceaniglobus roseus TaxID=1737570 RepID=UPI000C7EAD39|nr:DUF1992 domain-containing protein [Kandeliimicrobium roseum]